jgi:hypothetical protein
MQIINARVSQKRKYGTRVFFPVSPFMEEIVYLAWPLSTMKRSALKG